jgi:hypothetical protein
VKVHDLAGAAVNKLVAEKNQLYRFFKPELSHRAYQVNSGFLMLYPVIQLSAVIGIYFFKGFHYTEIKILANVLNQCLSRGFVDKVRRFCLKKRGNIGHLISSKSM